MKKHTQRVEEGSEGVKTSPGRQEQKTKNPGCIDFSRIYLTSKTPKKALKKFQKNEK